MEHIKEAWKGFCDSWGLWKPIMYVIRSPGVLNRVVLCTIVNGALFIGSILFFNRLIDPFLHRLDGLLGDYLEPLITLLYYTCWLYPVYIVSFVLTTFWVQDIFDAAFKHFYQGKVTPSPPLSPAEFLSYLVRRIVVIAIFMAQCTLFAYLPFPFGRTIEIMHYCLLYSYYCFEYLTVALNIGLTESIKMFEYNWSYFLGFGISFTTMCVIWPGMMSAGIFSLLFPFLVLTSVPAEVNLKRKESRLPIFAVPIWFTNKIVKFIV